MNHLGSDQTCTLDCDCDYNCDCDDDAPPPPRRVALTPDQIAAAIASTAALGAHRCDPGCPGWFVDAESGAPNRCDDCWRHAPDAFTDDHAAAVHAAAGLEIAPLPTARERRALRSIAQGDDDPDGSVRVLTGIEARGWATAVLGDAALTQAGRVALHLADLDAERQRAARRRR